MVKHVELKLGQIVPKPVLGSFKSFLAKNYSAEQAESMRHFENVPIFTAKQMSIAYQGKSDVICNFKPFEVLTSDEQGLKENLREFF